LKTTRFSVNIAYVKIRVTAAAQPTHSIWTNHAFDFIILDFSYQRKNIIDADFLAGSTFEFIGAFDTITSNGENAPIEITGSVNTLTLNAPSEVTGDGKITTAIVSEDAGKGTSFETTPTSVTGGGKDDVTLPAPSTPSGSTGGGNTGGGNTTVEVTSVAELTPTADHNAAYTLPATVTANLSGGGTKTFAVVWTPTAADTSVCGIFAFEGALTMVTGYTNPNSVKASLTLTVTPVLTSIAVTQSPAKLTYLVGETLDIAGLVVTGTYSDDSTKPETVTTGDITGFDSATAGPKTLTVTVGGKTDTFTVTVYAAAAGELVSITNPAAITVANGAAKTAEGLNLPAQVVIVVDEDSANVNTVASVAWDVESADYTPATKTSQTFNVSGIITLPDGVDNTDDVALTATVSVTVSVAVYTVSFDLNGQTGAAIPNQTAEYNAHATEPNAPTSVSHDFVGWYTAPTAANGVEWIFDTSAVTADTILYAVWTIKTYTIAFSAGDYTSAAGIPSSLTVDHGSAAEKPADPTLAGHTFVGWYTDAGLETAYVWTAPVTSGFTLYAKFADALTAAKDALTFDTIKGANTSEQGIMTNLALPASLTAHPGVTIAWESDNAAIAVGGTTGTVTRPASDEADAEVTLTATLSLSGGSTTKTFNLIVRKQGITDIVVEGADERFASGYPVVSFDNQGSATLKIKLKPDTATADHPVVAYLVFDSNTDDSYTLDKESILYGHSVSVSETGGKHSVWTPSAVGELIINGDGEFTYNTGSMYWDRNQGSYKIGVVLLKDDDIGDLDAAPTLISLSQDEIGYIDVTPPSYFYSYLSENKQTIYVYFNEKLSTNTNNKPAPGDFTLENAGGVTVTAVAIDNTTRDFDGLMPGRVTLTLSGDISDTSDVQLTYTPGTNKLADTSSNEVISPITYNNPVNATPPTATAYINPTAGTMMVRFEPGLHDWVQSPDNFDLEKTEISLKYKAAPATGFAHDTGLWSNDWTEVYYKFTPLQSGSYSAADFTFSVAAGLRFWNLQTIVITDKQTETPLPTVTAAGTTAAYDDANSQIVLTLPEGTVLGSTTSSVACNFVLTVDGSRVLYRASTRRYFFGESYTVAPENVVYLPLTGRLKEAIAAGLTVTLSYQPDEHAKLKFTHLVDVSGAYIPAFAAVTVIK
jgi:uncharacterized repeat protein (TIGR02543 family)